MGARSTQRRAFIAGFSGETVKGTAQPVVVNAFGSSARRATSAKSSAAKPLSAAAGRRLATEVRRLQRQNRQQAKEIRALRAQNG
jgi:3-phosphoglycerate kinase